MQFSTSLLVASIAALASAQNPFTFTSLSSITAGTPFNITWAPSTGTSDTISLVLRQGSSTALDTVETIASKIQNTGSFLWTPSSSLTNGPNYAFQIVDDGNTAIVNYSNQFSISSTNTVTSARSSTASSSAASSASSASASSASASASSGSAATTGTSSRSASSGASSTTGSARTTSSGSATSSASQSATSAPSNTNAAGSVTVSGGLLAVMGALMALL